MIHHALTRTTAKKNSNSLKTKRITTDVFGRPVTNLRISITSKCNLNCAYCHKEGRKDASFEREMNASEIVRLARIASTRLGITSIKITGGEPLMRPDVCDIVQGISGIPGIKDLSLTTNAMLLNDETASNLHECGLDRINVSCDFPQFLEKDTGTLRSAVIASERAGLVPIKINMLVLRGTNHGLVREMIKLLGDEFPKSCILQLIELINMGDSEFYEKNHYDLRTLEKWLLTKATEVVERRFQSRKKYHMQNGLWVEVVRPMHNTDFCAHCTRIRLTSDGFIKPCLMRDDNLVDVLSPLRAGASDRELGELFVRAAESIREPFWKKKEDMTI